MSLNDRTPLSPSAQEALDALHSRDDAADGRSQTAVVDLLVTSGFEQSGANAAVTELQSKGYVYIVNDTIFLTPE